METLRVKLSESESKVAELLKVSEALEEKLSQSEHDRRTLQTQLDTVHASDKKPTRRTLQLDAVQASANELVSGCISYGLLCKHIKWRGGGRRSEKIGKLRRVVWVLLVCRRYPWSVLQCVYNSGVK